MVSPSNVKTPKQRSRATSRKNTAKKPASTARPLRLSVRHYGTLTDGQSKTIGLQTEHPSVHSIGSKLPLGYQPYQPTSAINYPFKEQNQSPEKHQQYLRMNVGLHGVPPTSEQYSLSWNNNLRSIEYSTPTLNAASPKYETSPKQVSPLWERKSSPSKSPIRVHEPIYSLTPAPKLDTSLDQLREKYQVLNQLRKSFRTQIEPYPVETKVRDLQMGFYVQKISQLQAELRHKDSMLAQLQDNRQSVDILQAELQKWRTQACRLQTEKELLEKENRVLKDFFIQSCLGSR